MKIVLLALLIVASLMLVQRHRHEPTPLKTGEQAAMQTDTNWKLFPCDTGCSAPLLQFNADGTLKFSTQVGSSLVIDEWKCTIRKDFDKPGIRCDNTSDYCAKLFDRVKEFHKHIFGCIDPKSPNHPCNYDEVDPMEVDTIDEVPVSGRQMAQYNYSRCGPHGVGSYRIDTD